MSESDGESEGKAHQGAVGHTVPNDRTETFALTGEWGIRCPTYINAPRTNDP